METKRARPVELPVISLEGEKESDGAMGVVAFLRELREGVRAGKFSRGDYLPQASELSRLYRVPEAEVERAITDLRAEGLLQYADEYIDTYFIDVPRHADALGGKDPDVALRVERLEANQDLLLRRIEALENELRVMRE